MNEIQTVTEINVSVDTQFILLMLQQKRSGNDYVHE